MSLKAYALLQTELGFRLLQGSVWKTSKKTCPEAPRRTFSQSGFGVRYFGTSFHFFFVVFVLSSPFSGRPDSTMWRKHKKTRNSEKNCHRQMKRIDTYIYKYISLFNIHFLSILNISFFLSFFGRAETFSTLALTTDLLRPLRPSKRASAAPWEVQVVTPQKSVERWVTPAVAVYILFNQ